MASSSAASRVTFGEHPVGLGARLGAHVMRQSRQPVLAAADFRRQRLRERQAEHGERPVGFEIEHALHQRAGAGLRHALVDDEDLRQPVAVLAEIGEDFGPARP